MSKLLQVLHPEYPNVSLIDTDEDFEKLYRYEAPTTENLQEKIKAAVKASNEDWMYPSAPTFEETAKMLGTAKGALICLRITFETYKEPPHDWETFIKNVLATCESGLKDI